ncbi:MAG: SufS family cysteine desulfurase [Chloroflexi bacterium]|nr:SufS family cysteine desulfurase [Chloroflexota bacterium]
MPTALDLNRIRADFPALQREVRPGVSLVYLDSTASSLKPRPVVERLADFYLHHYANIHRGIHTLAEEATAAYEAARQKVALFLGASEAEEIIFVRNATEAVNLVAHAWARVHLRPGDLIVTTEAEHHANIVPWQMLAAERGLRLEFGRVDDQGRLDLEHFHRLLAQEPRLVAFTHMSNVTGVIPPVAEMTRAAHAVGARVLVDGAQAAPHLPINLAALGVDFYAVSAHKMLGPSGIGALYARREVLDTMQPFLGGGGMIRRVTTQGFAPAEPPAMFEAGTPAIAEAVGWAAAIDYLQALGMERVRQHERDLGAYALERLRQVPGLRLLGPATMQDRGAVFAFWLDAAHPHDVAQVLDHHGVAVRAGHHCAQPLHRRFGVPASARAGLYLYNTRADIDRLIEALEHVVRMFA